MSPDHSTKYIHPMTLMALCPMALASSNTPISDVCWIRSRARGFTSTSTSSALWMLFADDGDVALALVPHAVFVAISVSHRRWLPWCKVHADTVEPRAVASCLALPVAGAFYLLITNIFRVKVGGIWGTVARSNTYSTPSLTHPSSFPLWTRGRRLCSCSSCGSSGSGGSSCSCSSSGSGS